jgi:TPR repeat protein
MKWRFAMRPEARESSTAKALLTAYDAVADSNFEAAHSIMRRLADEKVAEAQHFIGWCFQQGVVVKQSNEEALCWWLKAAAQGFGASQSAVAACYENGQGTDRNLRKAYKFHYLARKSGVASSDLEVARLWSLLSPSEKAEVERV